MLASLSKYQDDFEPQVLSATKKFFVAELAEKIQGSDVATFLQYVQTRLREENDRCSSYLLEVCFHLVFLSCFEPLVQSTRRPLMQCVESVLLGPLVLDRIIEMGFDQLMDESRIEQLRLMFGLFARVSALPTLELAFNTYLKRVGGEIVTDKERDKSMIQDLLDLKLRAGHIIANAFQDSDVFHDSDKRAFEHVINVRPNRPSELLAKHVDGLFKSSKLSDDQMEEVLDRILVLLRYVNGKDVFEAFYKKDLAKRLLLSRSLSPEWYACAVTVDPVFSRLLQGAAVHCQAEERVWLQLHGQDGGHVQGHGDVQDASQGL